MKLNMLNKYDANKRKISYTLEVLH